MTLLAYRIVFVTLTVVLSYASCSSLVEGSICFTNWSYEEGVCRKIKDCPSALTALRQGTRPTVCNKSERSVCCPKLDPIRLDDTSPNLERRISEKKCQEYSEISSQEVRYPAIIPGENDVVHKVDKCMHKSVELIVNGEEAKDAEFPHMALLGYEVDSSVKYSCGGSLVSPNFVLTAAHCLTSSLGAVKFILLGMNSRNDNASHVYSFLVKEYHVHQNYSPNAYSDDIGLIELKEYVPLSERLLPICLPQKYSTPERAVAIGFGISGYAKGESNGLLKVTLQRFSISVCQEVYEDYADISNETMICYGHHTERKDTCNGDSGGALQIFNSKHHCTYTLIGITSFGMRKCGQIGNSAVYVNVYHYLDWIERIVWPNSE